MLEFYQRLAAWLRPHAWLGWLLGAGATATLPAAVFLVDGAPGQNIALAAIATLLWVLTLSAFIRAFADPLPAPDPQAGLGTRVRARLKLLYRGILVLLISGLLLLVLWFSIRALLLISAN